MYATNAGGVVDKRGASVGVRCTRVGLSPALLLGEHALHQGAQALAPARGRAPGPAGHRHSTGMFVGVVRASCYFAFCPVLAGGCFRPRSNTISGSFYLFLVYCVEAESNIR